MDIQSWKNYLVTWLAALQRKAFFFFFPSVFSAEVKKLPDFSKEFILKVRCSDLHFPTQVYYISEFVGAYPAP